MYVCVRVYVCVHTCVFVLLFSLRKYIYTIIISKTNIRIIVV